MVSTIQAYLWQSYSPTVSERWASGLERVGSSQSRGCKCCFVYDQPRRLVRLGRPLPVPPLRENHGEAVERNSYALTHTHTQPLSLSFSPLFFSLALLFFLPLSFSFLSDNPECQVATTRIVCEWRTFPSSFFLLNKRGSTLPSWLFLHLSAFAATSRTRRPFLLHPPSVLCSHFMFSTGSDYSRTMSRSFRPPGTIPKSLLLWAFIFPFLFIDISLCSLVSVSWFKSAI